MPRFSFIETQMNPHKRTEKRLGIESFWKWGSYCSRGFLLKRTLTFSASLTIDGKKLLYKLRCKKKNTSFICRTFTQINCNWLYKPQHLLCRLWGFLRPFLAPLLQADASGWERAPATKKKEEPSRAFLVHDPRCSYDPSWSMFAYCILLLSLTKEFQFA